MKKYLLILAVALGMSVPAHAQLDIKKYGDKPKKVSELTHMWNWLYTQEGGWYLVTKTTNQFDAWIWIALGDSIESAIASVDQLLELYDTIGDDESFEITDRDHKTVLVTIYKQMGARQGFAVHAEGRADPGYVYKGGIKKAKTVLEKELQKASRPSE